MALWSGYEPFGRQFRRLQREMDNVFGDFENNMQLTTGPQAHNWAPRCDVKEQDNKLIIHAELPGVPKDQIHVQLDQGVLTVSGERKIEKKEDKDKWHRVERSYGYFSRSFDVGTDVKPEDIRADYKDGVLEVTMPKPKHLQGADQPKRITIN